MTRLIQLNQPAGHVVYVNPVHVVKIEPQPTGLAGAAKLTLTLDSDPVLVVTQTADEVADLIRLANSAVY
jgi:hypothetical protein